MAKFVFAFYVLEILCLYHGNMPAFSLLNVIHYYLFIVTFNVAESPRVIAC